LGKCNDADPGDIGFKEWTCAHCGGDGITPDLGKITVFVACLMSIDKKVEIKGKAHAETEKEKSSRERSDQVRLQGYRRLSEGDE
jgi:hypothetical protein